MGQSIDGPSRRKPLGASRPGITHTAQDTSRDTDTGRSEPIHRRNRRRDTADIPHGREDGDVALPPNDEGVGVGEHRPGIDDDVIKRIAKFLDDAGEILP